MKTKVILIFLTIASMLFISSGVIAQTPEASQITLPDNKLMLVTWLEENDTYLFSVRGPATFEVSGNIMYHDGRAIVNRLDRVGYGVYVYKPISRKIDDQGNGVVQHTWELDLEEVTADTLPKSQHIAKLIGVYPDRARPATVVRKFLGETYEVNCLVSQSVVELYQAGKLNIGDFVIVSFIDEIPDSNEYNLAIVVDKVYKSW